ncbi:MAG: formylglycine-generating enzyme family protein [Deltaproteobacteria bacterium]|nr:formylglycine-generating enzyme family protein [Deltaproteobacteria bacterium]
MQTSGILLIFVILLLGAFGCSVYVDDFKVSDTPGTDGRESDSVSDVANGSDGTFGTTDTFAPGTEWGSDSNVVIVDTNADSDSISDTGTDVVVQNCAVSVTSPSGSAISFCAIPAGTTLLGCNPDAGGASCVADELPLHPVTLSAFDMMKTEVTHLHFWEFVQANPLWEPEGTLAVGACNTPYLSKWFEGVPLAADENKPLTEVCFDAAKAYCNWLGTNVSLPTEAQFEKAARGNYTSLNETYRLYPFDGNISCTKANYYQCYSRILEVGTVVGDSPFGIQDMAGNVAEWTLDLYREDFYCNPTEASSGFVYPNCNTAYQFVNPKGSASGTNYVIKGGSWSSPAGSLRITARDRAGPRVGSNLVGFRCVRNR